LDSFILLLPVHWEATIVIDPFPFLIKFRVRKEASMQ